MNKQNKAIISFLLLALIFTSCGESGSGPTQPQVASGGIGGTGISQGTVTGFGSVILNGVKFNTDDTSFIIDDNQTGTSQSDLSIGMQVKVTVDATGKKATEVVFEPQVEGPVDSNNAATNTLVVLGRTVVIDNSTKIEDSVGNPIPPASLVKDDMLDVSGLVLADDKIQATFIKKKSSSSELELKGKVKALTGTSFFIGNQEIDFSGAKFEDMAKSDLTDGMLVEAKGTRGAAGTVMTANVIEREDSSLGASDNEKVEIEGPVTEFDPGTPNLFSVSGQAVSTSGSTDFEDGAEDDLALNVRLEVEGKITNGVLVASKVKFHGNRIKIEADVEFVETDPTQPNSVTLLGQKVIINDLSDLRNKRSSEGNSLSFSDILKDERLEIRGYLSEGVITATRVERQDADPDSNILLQAPVQKITGTELTLLELTVKTDGASFEDEAGDSISPSEFFSQIEVGSLVKVRRGTISGSIITATEMEIED